MKRTLIVIDMQKDFIDGALGTPEAQAIVPAVREKISTYRKRGDEIIFTRDTHVIATSRVDSYTGDLVSFHYNRHEDDQYVQETIPVMDFIKRLIRHIPEKHFKMIRYGGLYARHRSIDKKLHLAISKEKRHTFRCFNRWRTAILSSFGYDPLICPHCKQQMVILEIYHNHRRVPLEELYEKAMSRSRRKRSSACPLLFML